MLSGSTAFTVALVPTAMNAGVVDHAVRGAGWCRYARADPGSRVPTSKPKTVAPHR